MLLIDLDAQANLTTGLGLRSRCTRQHGPRSSRQKKIEDVILPTSVKNLDLIPADTWLERVEVTGALAADRYSHERLKEILKPLKL